jgi:hypothetical protein
LPRLHSPFAPGGRLPRTRGITEAGRIRVGACCPEIRQKGNRGHRLWTRAPCICTTGLGQRFRAVRRSYGLREMRARSSRSTRPPRPPSPPATALPADASVGGASGGIRVNRRSDRQSRSALAFPSVAKRKLAPAPTECWIVAIAIARRPPVRREKESSRRPTPRDRVPRVAITRMAEAGIALG